MSDNDGQLGIVASTPAMPGTQLWRFRAILNAMLVHGGESRVWAEALLVVLDWPVPPPMSPGICLRCGSVTRIHNAH